MSTPDWWIVEEVFKNVQLSDEIQDELCPTGVEPTGLVASRLEEGLKHPVSINPHEIHQAVFRLC